VKFKKSRLIFIAGGIILLVSVPIFAQTFLQKIDVAINKVSLFVNNEQVGTDNFLYEGTTYVPLKLIAEMTGMKVKWDDENKRVDLTRNEDFSMKTTDKKYNIISTYPRPFTDGNYLKWNYLTIVFDSNTKKINDDNKVVLMDYKGNKIDVKCKPGSTAKDNFLVIPEKELNLDTYYSLYIPRNLIVMENGDLYGEEIFIYFKTATNAIRGHISSDSDLFGKTVIMEDSKGSEYFTKVVGKNEFYFSNIPSGKYKVIINDDTFENILIRDNTVNSVKLVEGLEE
jgi:hypothetical protein